MAAAAGDTVIEAAVVAALAAAVLLAPAPARTLRRLRADAPGTQKRTRVLPGPVRALGVVCACGLALLAFPGAALWVLIAATVLGTLGFLVRGQLRRRTARAAASECARAARILSGLLTAGQIPTAALAEAATECQVFAPAAAAASLGSDVADELERCAQLPGRSALGTLAAAWRLGQRSGAPMATILNRVAGNLRSQQQLDTLIEAELAAARTSGHIMAALPALAVGLGFAVGINPLSYLVGEPLGRVLLLAGVGLTAAGVLWIDALSRPSGTRR